MQTVLASIMTHQLEKPSSKMVRSQSSSRNLTVEETNHLRRKSIAHVGERKSTAANLRNERRGSMRADFLTTKQTGSPSSRSRSLRTPNHKRNGFTANGSNISKEASPYRGFNHSLSVPEDDNELHRLRNFSVTSKGIVNRGDSFRCKSNSRSSSPRTPPAENGTHLQVPEVVTTDASQQQVAPPEVPSDASCSQAGKQKLVTPTIAISASSPEHGATKYRVWIVGLPGVGKTSLKLQFMTSEYICQMDNKDSTDENVEKNVTIVVDGDECDLEISEFSGVDEKMLVDGPIPDAFLVVYAVTNRRSYLHTKQIVSTLEPLIESKAVILVGNKTDLARLRTIETLEGRSLAKEWGCKFVETSVAINHQVDELLVGIITQIHLKAKLSGNKVNNVLSRSRASKATGIIKRLWRKTCVPNKSCDNLHTV